VSEVININSPPSYPPSLVDLMESYRKLFFDYNNIEKQTLDMRLNDDENYLTRKNPYTERYYNFIDEVLPQFIEKFSIKGWHYTRLLEKEVEKIKLSGLIPSTFETFKSRVNFIFKQGLITLNEKELIFNSSPLNIPQQKEARENRFWFVSCKVHPDDSGVRPLLSYWGGEVSYFWMKDKKLKEKLSNIGSGRIIEANVPLSNISRAYCAGKAMLANYFDPEQRYDINRNFDFYIQQNLEPQNIKIIPLREFIP